jgi:hypothetical protein
MGIIIRIRMMSNTKLGTKNQVLFGFLSAKEESLLLLDDDIVGWLML